MGIGFVPAVKQEETPFQPPIKKKDVNLSEEGAQTRIPDVSSDRNPSEAIEVDSNQSEICDAEKLYRSWMMARWQRDEKAIRTGRWKRRGCTGGACCVCDSKIGFQDNEECMTCNHTACGFCFLYESCDET